MKQHQIEFSNRFIAWENLSGSKDMNRAWENNKEKSKPKLKRV